MSFSQKSLRKYACPLSLTRALRLALMWAACLLLMMPGRSNGNDDQMTINGIRFRRIPSGKLPLVDPAEPTTYTDKKNDVLIREFWIAESELSQQQYVEIQQGRLPLPLPDLDTLRKRSDFSDSSDLQALFDREESRELPVFGLTASEAVVTCIALNQMPTSGSGLVTGSFRLPTEFEWQYAARGITSRDDPMAEKRIHVALWPDNPTQWLRTVEQRNALGISETHWEEFRKAIGISAAPTDAQLHPNYWVPRLTDSGSSRLNSHHQSAVLGVWRAVWKKANATIVPFGLQDIQYGGDGIPASNPEDRLLRNHFQNASARGQSGWGLQHIHGNASEWCIRSDSVDYRLSAAGLTWDNLRHALDSSHVLLCGSSSGDSIDSWMATCIWESRKLDRNQYDSPPNAFSYAPGIRLVWSASGIADDWIVQISQRVRQLRSDEFTIWADRQHEALRRTNDDPERNQILATLSFYQSLTAQRDVPVTAAELAAGTNDTETSEYLSLLSSLNGNSSR